MNYDSRTDPENYQDSDNVKGVESEILRAAFESAKETYATCGGHWRAHRMETAMKVIATEMSDRGEPVADQCSNCGSAVEFHVKWKEKTGRCTA